MIEALYSSIAAGILEPYISDILIGSPLSLPFYESLLLSFPACLPLAVCVSLCLSVIATIHTLSVHFSIAPADSHAARQTSTKARSQGPHQS